MFAREDFMGRIDPGTREGQVEATAGLRARMDELAALVPDLPPWPGTRFDETTAHALLDLIERKQRQLIRFNVRLAGLRELTEALLRDPEEERVLRSISLYLGHAYGLPEVLVLTKTPDGGLRGYRSRAVGKGLCEAVRWPGETLRGTHWEAALGGDLVRVDEHPSPAGTPPPLPFIFPLVTDGEDETERAVMGVLALRPDAATGAGVDPLEVEQIVFQAATLFESVRHHRRATQETRFRECLFQAMGDGLIATDPLGRVTAVNRAALEMLATDAAALMARPVDQLADRAPSFVELFRRGLDGAMPALPAEASISRGRERIPVSVTLVGFEDGPGDPGGMLATLSDLRPVRAMEEEMRRLDRLAALGRFATAVAHEIRNPLAAIGAGIDYLSRSVGQDRADDIQLLRGEIGRLDRIVRGLLEPTKRRPLDLTRTEVSSLVRRACKATEPLASERRQRFVLHPATEEALRPVAIVVDEERMLQVLVNLVRNAVEASPEGDPVEIGWEVESGEGPPSTRLWVRDHGPGIPADALTRIFEPFYSTKAGGTGLGLYVSHSFVDQHGGKLFAEIASGGGTCMQIRLPMPAA
jgi:signal transduction histidine kinase